MNAQIPFLFAQYHFYIKTIMYQEIRKLSYALIAILVVLGGLFVFQVEAIHAAAGINKKINFQGKVTNTDGTNVTDGSYSFVFSIYAQQAPGGAVVWTETKSLTVTDGIFQTNLGDTTVLPGSVDFNTDNIFLGINFNTNGEMTPRVQFTASPYAFNSDKLEGGTWEIPGAIGSITRNSALFTTLGVNGSATLASTAGSTMTLGNSTGAATVSSGGVSSWTNAAGNLTFSTTSSGILALTSAGALNLSAASASTMTLANVTNSFNIDSNTLSVDALNNRIGIGTAGPTAFLDVVAATTGAASIRLEASAGVNPSAPNIGDMWFNGSNLYFRKDGSTSQDLLAAGGGGMTNPMTTQGDLIFGGTSGAATRLAGAGTDGFVLKYALGTNTPYWAADLTGGAAGPWTDDTGVSYLTDVNEDLAIGASTIANAPFSVDVSLNTVRVGSGATNNGKIEMLASNGATGSIEYTNNDSWNFADGKVGIGNSNPDELLSVGSATNRGDIGVYGDVIEEGIINQESIPGVIVDTFVYDTTRDSDGGRWIESRQSSVLSWQKETIDATSINCNIATNDRCGSMTFPRKAMIVATLNSVYVYDVDDNSMWMKFSQGASNALGVDANNDPSSVFALNGVIYIGTNNSAATGLYAIDFVNDRMYNYDATDRSSANVGISARNAGAVTYGTNNTIKMKFYAAASSRVNDVHGAVISGSSSFSTNSGALNGATFICAATDSSVAVINLSSGITLNYTSTAYTDEYSACAVTKRARLYGINKTKQEVDRWGAGLNIASVVNIDTALVNQATPTDIWDDTAANLPNLAVNRGRADKGAPIINKNPDTLEVIERASANSDPQLTTTAAVNTGDVIYVGTSSGLTEINDVETQAVTNIGMGWSKVYSKDGDTGYMHGTPGGYFGLNGAYDANSTTADSTIRTGVLTGNGHAPTLGVNGVHGTAARFSGTAQWLCSDLTGDGVCEQNTIYDSGTTGFAFELWFRHDATIAAQQTLLDRSLNATVAGYNLYMNAAGTLTANMRDGTNTDTATSTQTFNDGQWHHVFVQRASTALTVPTMAIGLYMFVDGRLVASDNTMAVTTVTLNGVTSLGIGASCTIANCSTAANLWVGDIDDVYLTATSASNSPNLNQFQIRKKYLEGRTALSKKSLDLTVSDISSSTTIGKTGSAWGTNDYAGRIVEIVSGTGIGQTRRISGNDATTLTVFPAWTITPTGATFEIQSEQLYGASNIVSGIGMTDNTFLGENRKLYAGTGGVRITTYANSATSPGVKTTVTSLVAHGLSNGATVLISGSSSYNGSWVISNVAATTFDITRVFVANDANGWWADDSGGVTLFEGMGNPSISNIWHADSGEIDHSGTAWSGSGGDSIVGIGTNGTSVSFGSLANTWLETDNLNFGAALDKITNNLNSVRSEMVADGLNATSFEIGMNGGADLAENYDSVETLIAGDVVQMSSGDIINIGKSTEKYQKTLIGVVATNPAIVMGTQNENSYPIALKGRVPVNVTTENGIILKGDQITSSSLAGFGMAAVESGMVIGTALEDLNVDTLQECSSATLLPVGTKCGQVMMFVNLMDFSGVSLKDLMKKQSYDVLSQNVDFAELVIGANLQDDAITPDEQIFQNKWQDIFKATNTLGFLNKLNDPTTGMSMSSEILAKNVNATGSVVSPLIVTDTLIAKHIKAESIEGLEFIQTGIDDANASSANNAAEVKTLGQQLSEIQNNLKALNEKVLGATTPADGLMVGGSAEFNGPAIFKTIAEFMDKVIFKNNVEFAGQVIFNKDMAGYAIIKEGTDLVDIEFEKEYSMAPIVNASLSLQSIEDEELRKAAEQLLLVSDVKFVITNVTTKGLQIRIGQKAISDIPFSWQATAIKDAKTFESKIPVLTVDRKDLFVNLKTVTETVQNAVPQVLPVEKTEVPISVNVENQQVAGVETALATD